MAPTTDLTPIKKVIYAGITALVVYGAKQWLHADLGSAEVYGLIQGGLPLIVAYITRDPRVGTALKTVEAGLSHGMVALESAGVNVSTDLAALERMLQSHAQLAHDKGLSLGMARSDARVQEQKDKVADRDKEIHTLKVRISELESQLPPAEGGEATSSPPIPAVAETAASVPTRSEPPPPPA